MKKLLLSLLATTACCGSSLAADLPPSAAPYDYAPAPIFTWTGFYGGLNGGVGIGRFTYGGGTYFGKSRGTVIGGTAGYNYQIGFVFVGAEADLDWADVAGTGYPKGGVSSSASASSLYTVRARGGIALGSALFFVTAGYAGAQLRETLTDTVAKPNFYLSQSSALNGYVVGCGLEYSFTTHISAKAEYLYNTLTPHGYFGATPDALQAGMKFSTLRAGVNYHF